MAWRDDRDGEGMWWKLANRNKRAVVLDLKDRADVDTLLRLVDDANVVVENFRPGTLERLGLGPDVLHGRNPDLVVTRVTGFGQSGPYAERPGFATIAEAMSGFAAINGEPDGQPLLPPIALTDEVTGPRRRVRHDGRPPQRRRAGRRRQPARDDVPPDGSAADAVRAHRRAAAAARRRASVHGAPRDLPVRGRAVGRGFDEQRFGRRSRARAARAVRRPAVRDVRRAGRASRRARGGDGGVVCRAHRRRGARRVHGRPRRGRAGDGHGRHRRRPALPRARDHRRGRRNSDAGADRRTQRDPGRGAVGRSGPRRTTVPPSAPQVGTRSTEPASDPA